MHCPSEFDLDWECLLCVLCEHVNINAILWNMRLKAALITGRHGAHERGIDFYG